jgi:hypothetical protein
MRNETVTVKQNDSARLEAFGLILSVRQVYGRRCDVVVGYPALPNTAKDMETGDAMLFETPHEGVFEGPGAFPGYFKG